MKYWVCKTAPGFIYEAMECLGGNGYVEESLLPRLYREAPVNAIWEGSGNVMCLDVLRALARPRCGASRSGRARCPRPPIYQVRARPLDFVERAFSAQDAEARARAGVEPARAAGGGSGIARSAPPDVAELFARTRLSARHDADVREPTISVPAKRALLERALPPT